MHKILVALFVLLFPVHAMASVEIVSLLPNPAGKDEDGEYIEIQNIGCNDVDISGYTLADANEKPYSIPQGSTLSHGQSRKFPHSETKIMLNNSGVEAVYLRDSQGNLIDEVQYTGTQKDDVPIILSVTLENCEVPSTNSGATSSGLQIPDGDTGSGSIPPIITESGGVLDDSDRSLLGTGQVVSDSGATSSGMIDPSITSSSGNTHSGTLSDSGSMYTETGLLSPLFMYYADTNNNNHIDTLEIVYPYILTGSVNTGAIFLYSNTGGLSSHRINTETGYIIGASLSGNILILHLLEGDIDSLLLKINHTTTSAIRLKSSSDLGFRSIGGQIPEDFFLTKSFDEYRSVSPKIEVGGGNPGTSGNGTTDTPLSPEGSGTTLFPEIFLTYQNYTNTSNSGEVITCTTMPCRVNGTFEPIFTGGFLQKDYLCTITFASGVYDSCNPPQFYPTSSGAISIQLIHKATGNSILKVYPIEFNILPTNSRGTPGILPPANNRAPIASIDMDGKWKKYFRSPEVNVIRCYAFSCSVNFTGENSYDPDGDVIRFLWIYDYSETSTKKDPGTRTFSIGNHTIILRVIDSYDAYGEIQYTIEVMHPDLMPKEEIEKEEKKGKVASKKTSKKTAKKKKLKPIIFFDPPKIILQNKHPEKIKMVDNTYVCYSKTKKCSINFALTGTQKGYTYEWIFPNQSGSYISKNPKSFSFSIGSSSVRMVVRDLAGNTLLSQDMTVRVIKTTKTRIKKQSVIKQKKTTERISREENQKIENSLPSKKETDSRNHQTQTPLALLGFLSVTGAFSYIRTRRISR